MRILYYLNPSTMEQISIRRAVYHSALLPVYERPLPDIDPQLEELVFSGYQKVDNGYVEGYKVRFVQEPDYSNELTRRAQEKCKQLLLECDWTIGNDSPLTEANQQEWRTYRTFLRNINHQDGFPKNIDWGTPPEQLKVQPVDSTQVSKEGLEVESPRKTDAS